ncbi:AAA family ATPase [Streptomyces sp. NPDC014733]|uniref:AAA family ATPase n=1 Tax=Streptomyces sp. NPDC014733 TaxID=3364885 RepID=UPI003700E8D6
MKGSAGEPIPHPFRGLSKLEVEFRRGELSIVAAAAGTGKSLLASNLAVQSNVPTLYWSADSNAATQLTRATAILTGDDIRDIKKALREDRFDAYEQAVSRRWWLRFNYSARPTPADMERDLESYREVFGIYPHLAVADNLSDLDGGDVKDAESYTFGLEGMCEYLNEMARETKSHVMAMHHVVGEYADGLKPIPQSGLKGKVSRVPSLILTIHKEIDGMDSRTLNVSPVKNREGFEDSSGETFASLDFDRRTMRLTDMEAEFG